MRPVCEVTENNDMDVPCFQIPGGGCSGDSAHHFIWLTQFKENTPGLRKICTHVSVFA